MFDIGWQEIFIIGVLAIVVVGPKDLPRALRAVAQLLRKGRAVAREFQGSVSEVIREAELDGIRDKIANGGVFDVDSISEDAAGPNGEWGRARKQEDQASPDLPGSDGENQKNTPDKATRADPGKTDPKAKSQPPGDLE